ncbi:hypothetical protein SAMN06265337_1813 [Hymenobacter gelipurpurascens]|uniref:Lipocalin-like domain-containing protein n=1 Tax=Hymenobacter gelipurpurascens TaxID=89968 RepID=A0A212TMG2_9BACT|nr:hypothetical protein [Hymenobacter gelipurpurascens]SNC67036.1 hypothetical protein SAMN06265337_1813 [Hymenobacter gelipurpurascens]
MSRISPLLVLLLVLFTGLVSSCSLIDRPDCGCVPPPRQPVTTASLTSTDTWYLQEATVSGKTTKTADLKDRYSMHFGTTGTYTQTLLADGTTYEGTWMLMGTDNRTLHLADHKGEAQEYTVEGAGPESLVYGRMGKTGQYDYFAFSPKP